MSSYSETRYSCDNCGRKLRSSSKLAIVISKSETSYYWKRLHVTVENHHGAHNDSEIDPADLCQDCTIFLLKNALKRVENGERLSAGVEEIDAVSF